MNRIRTALFALACIILGSTAATAGDPLFVNLTSDDAHRARMALVFSEKQHERGHPVTIFLNDRAVLIADRTRSKFKAHHDMLAGLMKKGATILICPMCRQHYGVMEKNQIEGIKTGSPELTGGALFAPGARSLTW